MKIFPVRFELTFTAPEAAALSIRPREQKFWENVDPTMINYTQF